MKRFVAGLLFAGLISSAFAQSGAPVKQSGNITPGQVPWWITSGVIGGGVTAADSPVTSFGATGPICSNSARQASGAWNSLCMQANTNSAATISLQNHGSAPAQSLNFNINGTIIPISGGGTGGAINRHSSSETTYTLQTSDCGNLAIATNNSNAMMWTLPQNTGLFTLCANMKITNTGVAPLFVDAQTGSLFNPWTAQAWGTLAGPLGFSRLAISQNQTATISADGLGNWLVDVYSPSKANGYEKSLYTTSYSLSNGGPFFTVSGTPTIGDTIGFDYIYETTPGGPGTNTLSFRYTFTTNTVAELATAAQSLIAQMKNNSTLVAITGPDQAQYFVAVQVAPLPNPQWLVAMNQQWPFNPNNNPHVTVVNTPPGHTATIVQSNDNGGGTVVTNIDIGSWFGCTRGTIYAGRQPQAGDRICGFFVGGETTGNAINNSDYQPIYGSFQWTITDPTPGIAKADLLIGAGTINLQVGNSLSWGLGGVTITGGVLNVNANFTGVGGASVPAGTIIAAEGPDGGPGAFINARGFGGGPGALVMQTAGGTGAVPTAITASVTIGSLSFGGYNGNNAYTQSAAISGVSCETYTAAHSCSQLDFYTTPITTNAITKAMVLHSSGALGVGNTFDAGTAGRISAISNTAASFTLFAGTRFYASATDGTVTTNMVESFGASGSIFGGRSSGGTGTTPTATLSGTSLVTLNGYGFTNALTTTPNGAVAIVSDSLWTASNAATRITFLVTPTGSGSVGEQMRLNQSGALAIGVTTDSGNGTVQLKKQAFGSLTACSATLEGAMASVTDSNTATWGANVAAGGANHILAYCNASNWTVAAK